MNVNSKGDPSARMVDQQIIIDSRPLKHITLSDRILLNKEPLNLPTETIGLEGEVYKITYGDQKLERGAWGGKIDFIFTCISFAVGLGNVWRFPYLVYKNGGGAFLIPYGLMLFCVGLPIFFLEFAIGQFSSLGPISCWIISPLFKGLGYGMVIVTWYLTLYYNVIIAHCMFYLFSSFTSKLPWSSCGNFWNDNNTCFDGTNNTIHLSNSDNRMSPTEQYYDKYVLEVSDGIENFGLPSWKLLLCLLLCWIIVMSVLMKGVSSLGKISYFTALFPYVLLTILLIRSSFLPGAARGVKYYLTPQFHRLKDPNVWTDAATQIFFSLSCCSGGLINMASYNKFKNNCCRDAVIVALINCATSVFAGFVIFANLGFMANVKNVTIDKVAKGGPGLAFIVYPEALSNMPVAPLWSILFFFMMLTLGFGSQFSMVETVMSGFQDELMRANIIRSEKYRKAFRFAVCLIGFTLGIPMVCQGGIYLLTLLDWTVSGYPLLVLGLMEILVICYFYGIRQFKKDIALMTGGRPNWYWRITWLIITPIVMVFLLIFYFAAGSTLQYGDYKYPKSWLLFAQFVAMVPILLIPYMFTQRYCRDGGFILLKEYMKPSSDWGPADEDNRAEFIDLIRSNESLKKKCMIRNPNDPEGVEDNEETKFFQSKQSIIEKLNRVVTKEVARNTNYIGSEFQLNKKNPDLFSQDQKLIKSACNLAAGSLK